MKLKKTIAEIGLKNLKLSQIDLTKFPVDHYSSSGFVKMSSNPIMFKINNINKDYIDTTTSVSAVLGQSVHKALEHLFKWMQENSVDASQSLIVSESMNIGLEFLKNYSDGYIKYTDTIFDRQKLNEKYAFAFQEYIKYIPIKSIKKVLLVEKKMLHKIKIGDQELPIKLKGIVDLVYINQKDQLIIEDHKICAFFSKDQDIDGAKLLQGAFMYFLVKQETGIPPYSITFRECKHSKNRPEKNDLGETATRDQVENFTFVYENTPEMFSLFYRFYEDITNGLLGHQVYLPNLNSLYDREVSILAYLHRLDIDEEKAKLFKKLEINNITEVLKGKIASSLSMQKFSTTVAKRFISATTLNYKDMTMAEKIKYKLFEHGLAVDFHSVINGYSIDMYQFEPSIGLKMSKIESYVKDIEQVTGISGIRVLAPIPNSSLIGFEIPSVERKYPKGDILPDSFNIAIGVDILGNEKRINIIKAPHLLIAGATGAGKSVFLTSTIKQLLKLNNVELHLFDPKMVELVEFESTKNVIQYHSDNNNIFVSISNLVEEMNTRYKYMQSLKVKNISQTDLKYKFVIIDEFGDLVAGKIGTEFKNNILLLAQKARACGIHLILTTQRPSVKLIDGDIKANFPVRISFRTVSLVDSQVILDQAGAEKLLGSGDMILKTSEESIRLQGYNL